MNPGNNEEIRVSIPTDKTQLEAGNKALETIGKTAVQASQKIEVFQRSTNSLNRTMESAVRRVNTYGVTGFAKEIESLRLSFQRLQSSESHLNNVSRAWDRLMAKRAAADRQEGLAIGQRNQSSLFSIGSNVSAPRDFALALSATNRNAAAMIAKQEAEYRRMLGAAQKASDPGKLYSIGSNVQAPKDFALALSRVNREAEKLRLQMGSTTKASESFFGSFLKAQIAVDALQSIAGAVKGVVTEMTKYAAGTELYIVAARAVSAANGEWGASANRLMETMRGMGITTRDSARAVSQSITGGMGTSKLTQLSRMAQDVAVMAPESTSSDVLTRMLYAIQSAQPEMLRTVGVNVNFEKSYSTFASANKRTVESLTENEKAQIRLANVLDRGRRWAGLYEESLGHVGKQIQQLDRYGKEAANAIGQKLLPALSLLVQSAIGVSKFAQKNPEAVATGISVAGAAGIAAAIGGALGGPKGAIISASVTSVIVLGIKKAYDEVMSGAYLLSLVTGRVTGDVPDAMLRGAQGKPSTDLNFNPVKAAQRGFGSLSGTFANPGASALRWWLNPTGDTSPVSPALSDVRRNMAGRPDAVTAELDALQAKMESEAAKNKPFERERLKLIEEINKVRIGELTGLTKINAEYEEYIRQIKMDVALSGSLSKLAPMAAQLRDEKEKALKADNDRLRIEQDAKWGREANEWAAEAIASRVNAELAGADAIFEAEKSLSDRRKELQRDSMSSGIDALRRQEQAAVAALESQDTYNLAQKQGLEQQKLAVHLEYIAKFQEAELKKLEFERGIAKQRMQIELSLKQWQQQDIDAYLKTIDAEYDASSATMKASYGDQADLAKKTAIRSQAKDYQQAWTQAVEATRNAGERLFDALISKTSSFGEALKNILKAAVLSPLRQIAGQLTAMMFAPMTFAMQQRTGAGAMGGGGGMGSVASMGAALPSYVSMLNPSNYGGGGSGGGGGRGMGGLGNIGMLGGLGGLSAAKIGGMSAAGVGGAVLGGGALGMFGAYKAGQSDKLGWKIAAPAIGAVSGMAALGGLMAMFPALVAMGPAGWIAAAGIGAVVGLMAVFKKSAERKAREKIKTYYGIDVSDKGILTQIVGLAKQSYGGNLDVAVRAREIRDLIELYAMSTGQRLNAADNRPMGVNLSQMGGSFYQSGSYSNGVGYSYGGAIAPIAGLSKFTTPTAAPIVLDSEGTKEFWSDVMATGIVQNPRAVQAASLSAQSQNYGRTSAAVNLTDPLGATI